MTFEELIEILAEKHVAIQHSKEEMHFVNGTRQKSTILDSLLYYPAVLVNKGDTFGFSGTEGSVFKSKDWQLFIVDHVADIGDFEAIEDTMARCESIMDDFLKKIHELKHSERMLRSFDLPRVSVYYVENDSNALYGVMATFTLDEPFCVPSNKKIWQ